MSKITGGYYIKARKIQDSAIAKSPPHVREIWDWLLKTANHKDLKTYGVTIKRGQLFTSYQEILEELSWKVGFIKKCYKKHNVDAAMVWLRHEQMIMTQKTTRGLIVTICKYEYYQNPSNYEKAYGYDNEMTGLRQDASTINKNDNNDNNVNKKEYTGQAGNFDFEKIINPDKFPTWRNDVKEFLLDEYLKKAYAKEKKMPYANIELIMKEFVVRLNLDGDFKNSKGLRKHFGFYFAKYYDNKSNGVSTSKGFVDISDDYAKNYDIMETW